MNKNSRWDQADAPITPDDTADVPPLSADAGSASLAGPDAASQLQIVFIDGAVPDAQALARGVNPGVVAVVLDPGSDGVQQIADWLLRHHVHDAAAIDIVAHGADGEIKLGNALLSAATIADHQTQLAAIGNALKPGGEIQIYGCDVAQDATGVAFIQQLSQATGGASVASSSHLVGSAAEGGSWNLNVDVGTVDAGNPFTTAAIDNFTNELSLTSNQLFFTAETGSTSSTNSAGNRLQQISVNGTSASSNPVDLSDGNANGNAMILVNGIAVDAPLNEFFIANSNSSGAQNFAHNYYGLFKGATNPSGPNQSLSEIYAAPRGDSGNGLILGVALDQPNGRLYFVQSTYNYTTSSFTNQTGIFEISTSATLGTVPTEIVATGSLIPQNLALDTKDNLAFFTSFNDSTYGIELDVVNLSGGSIQTLATAPFSYPNAHAGGVAVNPTNHTAYFTELNGGTAAYNGIFDVSFTVSGSGSSASIASHGTLGTLYSGSHANVPSDIAIDPANGIFFVAGETAVVANGSSGNAAAILAGSLTNTSTTATLTQVFSVTQAESLTTISGGQTVDGPAFDDNPQNLFLESTPTISPNAGTPTFAQGGTSVALASSATVSNQDGQNLKTATVVIGGFLSGDTLTASTNGTSIGSSFSNGTLTLTGSTSAGGDTLANFQTVLDSVKFSSSATDPSNGGTEGTRTLSWTVSDGIISSSTPTTTLNIHAAFVNAGTVASSFTGGGSAVTLDGNVTATDVIGSVNGTITGATITIGNFVSGDTPSFTNQNGITGSFNSGTLTLSGAASTVNYTNALKSITYSFTPGADPTGGGSHTSRSISWIVTDGTVASPTASSTLNVIHAAPTIAASGTVSFTQGGSPVTLDSTLLITTPDSGSNIASAAVVIGNFLTGDTLHFTNQNGIIGSFNSGTLTLTGTASASNYASALESVTYSFTPSNGDPTSNGSDKSRTISWQVNDGVTSSAASSSTLAVSALCFCVDTLIMTPTGERPVQELAVGDLVTTHRGKARPIVWIGTGKVLATRGRRTAATPVIVRKHALAENVPNHDLRVTKGHSLYLDDALIPVEFLVNHRSIEWDDRAQEVELYHVEVETHDVLIANGAPAESYRDDGNRWLFRNANSGWDQPPKKPYAPVLTGGPIVDAAWRRLLDQAGPRPGLPLTSHPDLHLLADGQRIDARSEHGGTFVFRLPHTPAELHVCSRAASPAELGLARDPRVLGVALRRLVLWRGRHAAVADAEDPAFCDGFHDFEPDNGHRWTDGYARIPQSLLAGFSGALDVELHVASTANYIAEGGKSEAA